MNDTVVISKPGYTIDLDQLQKDVLDLCNYFRKVVGLPEVSQLSSGMPKNPFSCPIATTLGAGSNVNGERICVYSRNAMMKVVTETPREFQEFIAIFDVSPHMFSNLIDPNYYANDRIRINNEDQPEEEHEEIVHAEKELILA